MDKNIPYFWAYVDESVPTPKIRCFEVQFHKESFAESSWQVKKPDGEIVTVAIENLHPTRVLALTKLQEQIQNDRIDADRHALELMQLEIDACIQVQLAREYDDRGHESYAAESDLHDASIRGKFS